MFVFVNTIKLMCFSTQSLHSLSEASFVDIYQNFYLKIVYYFIRAISHTEAHQKALKEEYCSLFF